MSVLSYRFQGMNSVFLNEFDPATVSLGTPSILENGKFTKLPFTDLRDDGTRFVSMFVGKKPPVYALAGTVIEVDSENKYGNNQILVKIEIAKHNLDTLRRMENMLQPEKENYKHRKQVKFNDKYVLNPIKEEGGVVFKIRTDGDKIVTDHGFKNDKDFKKHVVAGATIKLDLTPSFYFQDGAYPDYGLYFKVQKIYQ